MGKRLYAFLAFTASLAVSCRSADVRTSGAAAIEGPIGTDADLSETDRQATWEGVLTGEQALLYIAADSFHPTWSPDGKTILLRRPHWDRTRFGGRKVWAFDADTLAPRLVTHGASNEFCPEWSPDGRNITFISDRPLPESAGDGGRLGLNLWIMDTDGSHLRPLTSCFRNLFSAVWSPAGKKLLLTTMAFGTSEGGGTTITHGLYVLDLAARTLRRIGSGDDKTAVLSSFWLKGGSRIGFIRCPWIWDWKGDARPTPTLTIFDLDGSEISSSPCDYWVAVPSPDGERLLALSWTGEGEKQRIAILDAQGREKNVVYQGESGSAPGAGAFEILLVHGMVPHMTWSPDSKKVAFAASREGKVRVFVAASDGSGLRELVEGPGLTCAPVWSPAGQEILFFSYPMFQLDDIGVTLRAHPHLVVVKADGSDLRRFTGADTIVAQERQDLDRCLKEAKDPTDVTRIRERLKDLERR